jgi:NAD(P)H dehydrogenase (quinone)
MRVLTIYAHHNPRSFCHALLERFTEGLHDAGHTSQIVDLHAIGFNPVFRDRDTPGWVDDSVPDDVLEYDTQPAPRNTARIRALMTFVLAALRKERGLVGSPSHSMRFSPGDP